ncbi:hypothetical protein QBC35DRAFT_462514 [Podospora australis]|uniref:Uncharacterized protein n=1 Tax=Podospora australis TaxID=1536484 RepID=A0AAN6WVU4_9PEZI|nr:hypothetical protein QBC35DRAFT_462514 [Podospora australis]
MVPPRPTSQPPSAPSLDHSPAPPVFAYDTTPAPRFSPRLLDTDEWPLESDSLHRNLCTNAVGMGSSSVEDTPDTTYWKIWALFFADYADKAATKQPTRFRRLDAQIATLKSDASMRAKTSTIKHLREKITVLADKAEKARGLALALKKDLEAQQAETIQLHIENEVVNKLNKGLTREIAQLEGRHAKEQKDTTTTRAIIENDDLGSQIAALKARAEDQEKTISSPQSQLPDKVKNQEMGAAALKVQQDQAKPLALGLQEQISSLKAQLKREKKSNASLKAKVQSHFL